MYYLLHFGDCYRGLDSESSKSGERRQSAQLSALLSIICFGISRLLRSQARRESGSSVKSCCHHILLMFPKIFSDVYPPLKL